MTIATGPFKQLRFKKETTWGTLAGSSGGQILRRNSSDIDEDRDTYGSSEIVTDQQRHTFVHGTRTAKGSIDCDISGGTYALPLQSLYRRDFTILTAMTSLSLTMAGSGPTYTVTRSAGSFLTDGAKVGMVVRITAGAVNANNLNKNLFIVTLTATVATVIPWGNGTLTAEGPIATCTVSMSGKLTYMPITGHTNDSYTFEHWFSDLAQSEQFGGCRIAAANFDMPASGMAGVKLDVLGKGMIGTTSSAYFTAPTAATSSQGMTAVNGVLRMAGAQQSVVTALTAKVDGGMTTGKVVGSNYTPDVFAGIMIANGSLTAYFDSITLRDAYINESQIGLNVVMYAGTAAAAEHVCLTFPAIKLTGAKKSDGNGPISLTGNWEGLFNSTGGAGTDSEQTTAWIQDSLA